MLAMKTICERCQKALDNQQQGVFICSYECTFCESCARDELGHICSNCGGQLQLRPTRAEQRVTVIEHKSTSAVTRPNAASSHVALAHFSALLRFETDCWDVHHALTNNRQDFVLLDVRGEELFNQGHVFGAHCLPHSRINKLSIVRKLCERFFIDA